VTTAKAKPNPFDDIARHVNADLEAKDREAGRDDLTPALAKSVDQAKTKRAATKPAKPARPAKVQATGNGKMAFGACRWTTGQPKQFRATAGRSS
jgi:hypothetical protein